MDKNYKGIQKLNKAQPRAWMLNLKIIEYNKIGLGKNGCSIKK